MANVKGIKGSKTLRQAAQEALAERPALGDEEEWRHLPHRRHLTPIQKIIEDCEGMLIEEVLTAFTNKQICTKYHLDGSVPNQWRKRLGVEVVDRSNRGDNPNRSPEYNKEPRHPAGLLIRRYINNMVYEQPWHRQGHPAWQDDKGVPAPGSDEEQELLGGEEALDEPEEPAAEPLPNVPDDVAPEWQGRETEESKEEEEATEAE